MTITALLFCYRLPTLSPAEFRDYIEDHHVPYVKSLLGQHHPLTHTRHYTHKDESNANGVGIIVSDAVDSDADVVAVMTFENQEKLKESMNFRYQDGVREKIQADEDKFMDRSRVKVVIVGEDSHTTLRD
jgi:hypothetical protein